MLQLCVSSTLIKLTTSDWSRCGVVVPLLWCGAAVVVLCGVVPLLWCVAAGVVWCGVVWCRCCGVVQAGAGRLKRVPRVMALVCRP